MPRYRKKPIVVEAEQYRLGLEDGFGTIGESLIDKAYDSETYVLPECAAFRGVPFIKTLEGRLYISEGDWIIIGVKGERYPCKPDIFAATYDLVAEEDKDAE